MDNFFFLEARCANTNKLFYIRFDKAAGGKWCQTYGLKSIPLSAASNGFYNKMEIDLSTTDIGPQYKCPYCGNETYVRCGSCGKIACADYNDNYFSCPSCGHSGEISDEPLKNVNGNSGIGQA